MSGGRFLVDPCEVLCFEKILRMKSLLNENFGLMGASCKTSSSDVLIITEYIEFQNDFEEIGLDDDATEPCQKGS